MIVIGGGLAGLACAYELERAGWQATVLEARDRVGGRVWTSRKPFGEQHAELGAEWFAAADSTVLAYAKALRLRAEPVRAAARLADVIYLDGRRGHERTLVTPAVAAEMRRFWHLFGAFAARPAPALDLLSLGSLVDRARLRPLARALVEQQLRDRFSVEPANLSLLFAADVHRAERGRGSARYRIGRGNDLLAWRLAGRLADVRFKTQARHIQRSRSGVAVDDETADFCVLTVPARSWDAIAFSPDLPPPLYDVFEELQYGFGTKVLLQYESRFWRRRGESGSIVTDLNVERTWEATEGEPGERGILAAHTTGKSGALYSSVGDGARVLLAADEIDDVYPGSRALLKNSSTQAWPNDRWSRGTQIAYAPRQVTKYRDALRRPLGRLHFAGEHTDPLAGTMEGALRSGRRVAAALLKT